MEINLKHQSTSKRSFLKTLLVFIYLYISNTSTLAASIEKSSCFANDLSFDDAIIQIEQNGNYSTGVVIAKDRIITVAHALDESQKPMKILANIRGTHTSAQPLLIYKDTDLALLEVNTKNIRPIPLADNDIHEGEAIWTTGYPHGNARTIESGEISSVQNKKIVSSAKVYPGVSGGGLIRCDETSGRYELAGIVTSYLAKISGQEKINTGSSISLRIAYIKKLMSANAQLIGQHFFDNWHDKTLASRP